MFLFALLGATTGAIVLNLLNANKQ